MDGKHVGQTLIRLGSGGLVVSLIWWFVFYSEVNRGFGGGADGMVQALRCLILSTGPCGLVRGIANASGYFAYEPLLFWVSAAGLIAGHVVKSSAEEADKRHATLAARAEQMPAGLNLVEVHRGKQIFSNPDGHFVVEEHRFSSLQNARAFINGTAKKRG